MLQSLAILYAEHALARKIKYGKFSAILQTKSHRSPTTYCTVTGC